MRPQRKDTLQETRCWTPHPAGAEAGVVTAFDQKQNLVLALQTIPCMLFRCRGCSPAASLLNLGNRKPSLCSSRPMRELQSLPR